QIDSAGNLTFTPRPNTRGRATITVMLQDSGGTAAGGIDFSTQTFLIIVDKPYPLHNTLNSYDVSGDGHVAPNDALIVINWINAVGSKPIVTKSTDPGYKDGPDFYDVSRDNFVAPIDALMIINILNAGMGGEGEAATAEA